MMCNRSTPSGVLRRSNRSMLKTGAQRASSLMSEVAKKAEDVVARHTSIVGRHNQCLALREQVLQETADGLRRRATLQGHMWRGWVSAWRRQPGSVVVELEGILSLVIAQLADAHVSRV